MAEQHEQPGGDASNAGPAIVPAGSLDGGDEVAILASIVWQPPVPGLEANMVTGSVTVASALAGGPYVRFVAEGVWFMIGNGGAGTGATSFPFSYEGTLDFDRLAQLLVPGTALALG